MDAALPIAASTRALPGTRAVPEGLPLLDQLLRDREGLLSRIATLDDLTSFARAMIVTIAAGAGVFGLVLGSYRGGIQILYAGLKLPLVVLLTAALTTPALVATRAALGLSRGIQRDTALVLAALALGCLILAALSPLAFLAILLGAPYHVVIMTAVGCCAAGGVIGLSVLYRGLRSRSLRETALVALPALGLFVAVGAQMTWSLRPYVLRPRTPSPPFVRSLEGSFLDSVWTSSRSARGIYDDEPGE